MKIKSFTARLTQSLLRAPRCAGYGVQSPSAYGFLRKVVRERKPFSAYDGLADKWKESRHERERHRFYLRLANYLQPGAWLMEERKPVVEDYVAAGCGQTRVVDECEKPDVALLDLSHADDSNHAELYNKVMTTLDTTAVLIAENIRHDSDSLRQWRRIVSSERTAACFDLYDFGLAFFDKTRPKRCYNVMLPGGRE